MLCATPRQKGSRGSLTLIHSLPVSFLLLFFIIPIIRALLRTCTGRSRTSIEIGVLDVSCCRDAACRLSFICRLCLSLKPSHTCYLLRYSDCSVPIFKISRRKYAVNGFLNHHTVSLAFELFHNHTHELVFLILLWLFTFNFILNVCGNFFARHLCR